MNIGTAPNMTSWGYFANIITKSSTFHHAHKQRQLVMVGQESSNEEENDKYNDDKSPMKYIAKKYLQSVAIFKNNEHLRRI